MPSKKIYVGNIPFDATPEAVRAAFEAYGTVYDVSIISDRETGRSRGFGFVEMDAKGAEKAIQSLNATEFGGRELQVSEARERRSSGRRNR